ncbi:MAG: glycerophosphodiester phosphodiesterase [Defluviitaleaceae bacterium]|nr:glycerophosphodiester phosphodiesterase [Defluviitaleaceae bacterium]MCL2276193.1 glycerophosphodiester phosphodiesterase [Defluviitaleaceae bacterium]
MTKIIAHRGASAYEPENSLAAFALAVKQKADGIELDVHLSKDGEVMVFHDFTLERMTNGTGRICDYTLEELKQFYLIGKEGAQTQEKIPTLREVFELLAAHNRPLGVNIELKTLAAQYPEMPQKLADMTAEFSMLKIIYSSFNHYSLMAIRKVQPSAKIGLLYEIPLVDPHLYARHVNATAIHPPWQILAALPQTVADCHAIGVKVNAWTVNDPAMMQHLFSLGVDTIITDVPDICRSIKF